MDQATLEAAQKAEAALWHHDKECREGCAEVGHYHRTAANGRWRCPSGLPLWDAWIAFQPEKLPGSGTWKGPDGQRATGYVVEKVEKIGPYEIVYMLKDTSAEKGVEHWAEHQSRRYWVYADGKFEGSTWEDVDLDALLLVAIEFRRNGSREGAAYYAGKCLGMNDVELGK